MSCGPVASNLRWPLGAGTMEMTARDLRLMSFTISGMGRLSWVRGMMYCDSSVTVSTLRPGIDMDGGTPVGVETPEAGVEVRGVPLADQDVPLAFPLVPAFAPPPQIGEILDLEAAAGFGTPSSGKASWDWVSRRVDFCAGCFPAAFVDIVCPQEDDFSGSSAAEGDFKSSSGTSSTVTCRGLSACC